MGIPPGLLPLTHETEDLLINPFCFPHIGIGYGAKRICPANQPVEVHADASHRIYQGKEICRGSHFDGTIQHHLLNPSGAGEPGSLTKVIKPLSFLLAQWPEDMFCGKNVLKMW